MMKPQRKLLGLAILWFALLLNLHGAQSQGQGPLVLISMDAFRWDYTALHPAE